MSVGFPVLAATWISEKGAVENDQELPFDVSVELPDSRRLASREVCAETFAPPGVLSISCAVSDDRRIGNCRGLRKDSGPRAGHTPGPPVASLRSHLYRNLDAVYRGIARRVRREIDDAQLRPMGRMNGVTERPFVTARKAGRRFKADTIAIPASLGRGALNSTVQLAHNGRLAEIEASGADGNIDRNYLMVVGLGGT